MLQQNAASSDKSHVSAAKVAQQRISDKIMSDCFSAVVGVKGTLAIDLLKHPSWPALLSRKKYLPKCL